MQHTFMLGNISGSTLCHAAMIALKRCNLLLRVTSSMSCTSATVSQSPEAWHSQFCYTLSQEHYTRKAATKVPTGQERK